jgi:hypothetical protein
MKIVFFTHYSELYGANKSLINLIEGLISLYTIQPLVVIPTNIEPFQWRMENSIQHPFHYTRRWVLSSHFELFQDLLHLSRKFRIHSRRRTTIECIQKPFSLKQAGSRQDAVCLRYKWWICPRWITQSFIDGNG